jgi:hypothetical protein
VSIGYYVACVDPAPEPMRWLRRVLRAELDGLRLRPGNGWDGLAIGGVAVDVIALADWAERAAGWNQPASPTGVLYFGGTASGQLELWERLAEYVLPVLADETRGAVYFEDGELVHVAVPRADLDVLVARAAQGDERAIAGALERLVAFERYEVIEGVLLHRGDAVPRVAAIVAALDARATLAGELLAERIDVGPLLEHARPDAPPALRARIDARLANLADDRIAAQAYAYARENSPETVDLRGLLRELAERAPRAVAIVQWWANDYRWERAAAADEPRRQRHLLGEALVDAIARGDARQRVALVAAVLQLSYDEGLPRLRDALAGTPDLARLAPLVTANAERAHERERFTDANDWSGL